MPWLRGLDRGEERLRVVLDWRDPAVKQTFKLMLPVTLGLGLININAVIDVFFASRYIDGDLAPTAIQKAFLVYMLPQGMFSVAIATVLFPSLSRLAARGDIDGFRETVVARPAPDRLPADPGRRRSASCSPSRSSASSTSAAPGTRPDPGHRRLPRRLQRRARLQRGDADAEPRVLQPPVELDPDRRSRSATSFLNAVLDCALLPLRRVGDPALDRAREHRRHGRAARPAAAARSAASTAGGRRRAPLASSSRARSPPGSPTLVWKPLDDALGQTPSSPSSSRSALGLAAAIGASTSAHAASCACVSSTSCSPLRRRAAAQ